MMMQNWRTSHRLLLMAVIISVLVVVIFIAATALFDDQSLKSLSTALSTIAATIFGLLQVLPTLIDWLRPKEQLSDEQVKNAFEQLEIARQNLKEENFEEAIENATEVIGKLPKKAEAYRVRAQSHEKSGRIPSALDPHSAPIRAKIRIKLKNKQPVGYRVLYNGQ